jgi:hypothetical protein
MYKTVMACLDNLVDWGDNLFRQDTRESIDEAMMHECIPRQPGADSISMLEPRVSNARWSPHRNPAWSPRLAPT